MLTKENMMRLMLGLTFCLTGLVSTTFAEENADTAQAKPAVNVKKVFATNCSWCHDGFGMDAGKGPKLAGTTMTEEQIRQRILNGKSGGAMPGYKKVLTEEQVNALASYIKGLPGN